MSKKFLKIKSKKLLGFYQKTQVSVNSMKNKETEINFCGQKAWQVGMPEKLHCPFLGKKHFKAVEILINSGNILNLCKKV